MSLQLRSIEHYVSFWIWQIFIKQENIIYFGMVAVTEFSDKLASLDDHFNFVLLQVKYL